MQKNSYIDECLKKNTIIRWPDNTMPLKFYIAPCHWYKAQNQDYVYKQLVLDALNLWSNASGGKIRFEIVSSLHDSQINLDWKRVERTSLGHCYFNFDSMGRLFSAEVQIGLSDGVVHAQYQDEAEVFHTIIHEIGHALGLDHSPFENDIMYVPHQYGVVNISERDKNTINWLYKFPYGVTKDEILATYRVPGISSLDQLISNIETKSYKSSFEQVKENIPVENRDLEKERDYIADYNKYNISLQQVNLSSDLVKYIKNTQIDTNKK